MTQPGIVRLLLDRWAPPLHRFLVRAGSLSKPSEMDALNDYLRELRADIRNDIRNKTYIPAEGREVPSSAFPEEGGDDPFVSPIHQVIRQIMGQAQGGDAVSAQIAAVNRRSRVVRNILTTLLKTEDPLVLLGDPGTGKTMTLQQCAITLAESEVDRVFPIITLYVRLGEFHVDGRVGPEEVMDYVRRSVPPSVRPYVGSLDRAGGRLIILFDGMDEMSRERYNEHTEALSVFADRRRGRTKTLFSCRITDFSPRFIHQRLVLLPFNRAQITAYLRQYIPAFPIIIDGEKWGLRQLAKQLSRGGLPMEANNPFVLWLLCIHLQNKRAWPVSRVDLLGYYNEYNYKRKADDVPEDELQFPPLEQALKAWGSFAYIITTLNRGAAVPVSALYNGDPAAGRVEEMIRTGKRCGVLVEATDGSERLIRFEHHRFQEYFTAFHIHQTRPAISWLDKLDAPRWQETMLNLILMGGTDATARSLADSIAVLIRDGTGEGTSEPPKEEEVSADQEMEDASERPKSQALIPRKERWDGR